MTSQVLTQGGQLLQRSRMTVRVSTLAFGLCLLLIGAGYYAYWALWKLKFYYFGWAGCLLLVLWLAAHRRVRLEGIARDALPIVVWFAWLTASTLWSPAPRTTLAALGAGMLLPTAFFVAYAWMRSTSPLHLSYFFQFQLVLLLPLMLVSLFTRGQLYDESLGAVRTGFAFSTLTAIPFVIWRVRNRPSPWTAALLVLALITVLAVGSRSALLVAPVMLVGPLAIAQRGHGRGLRLVVTLCGLTAMLGAVAVVVPGFGEAIRASVGRFGPQETKLEITPGVEDEAALPLGVRTDIERRLQLFVAFQSFVARPVIGGGYLSTYAIIRDRFGMEVGAHGLPSTLLGETGIVGALIFLWMVARFFRRSARAAAAESNESIRAFYRTCRWAMVGLLLFGLFHQVDQAPQFFALLACGYASRRQSLARPRGLNSAVV